MSETWNIKFRGATDGESENPAKARFGRPCSRWIDNSSSAAPSCHQRQILNSAYFVGNWRGHDSRSGVELPKFFAVGRAVGAEYPIRAALKYKISAGREDASAFHNGKSYVPDFTLLDRIPSDEFAGRRWSGARRWPSW